MATKRRKPVTYQDYLKLPQLLSLQERLSSHHDEWQFILVHQAYELWFRLILIELKQAIASLTRHDLWSATKTMKRINSVVNTMIPQIHILETMSAADFGQFRPHLGQASGFDSWQFREVEILTGLSIEEKHLPKKTPIPKHPAGPTFREAWHAELKSIGPTPTEAIVVLYHQPGTHPVPFALLQAIEDYEECFAVWRHEHARLAERMIGLPTHGTGGSGGVAYLDAAARRRFFPEINEARARLMSESGGYPPHQ